MNSEQHHMAANIWISQLDWAAGPPEQAQLCPHSPPLSPKADTHFLLSLWG